MIRISRCIYILLLFTAASHYTLYSQENTSADKTARDAFYAEASLYSAIFNGRLPDSYPVRYEGTYYIYSPDFMPGTISVNNKYYDNVLLNINAHRDQLYILLPTNENYIVLNPDRIDHFTMEDRRFKYYNNSAVAMLPSGYYEVLYDDALKLVCHRKKIYKESIKEMKLVREFNPSTTFYVIDKGVATTVSGKQSLLKLLSTHKKELRLFCRKENLDFRNQPGTAYTACISYYTHLLSQTEEQ